MAYVSKSVGDRGAAASFGVVPPAGNAAGHIALLVIGCETDAAVVPPSGFAVAVDVPGSPSTAQSRLIVMWKRLTAAESSAWSVTFSGGGSTWGELTAYAFSGRLASGNPIGASSTQGANGTSLAFPSITATAGADLVYAATSFNDTSWTPPSGMTEVHDAGGNTGVGHQVGIAAGATSVKTLTSSTSGPIRGALFMLLPAAAASEPKPWQIGSIGF